MKNHPNGSLKNIMVFSALANWVKGYEEIGEEKFVH